MGKLEQYTLSKFYWTVEGRERFRAATAVMLSLVEGQRQREKKKAVDVAKLGVGGPDQEKFESEPE